VEKHASPPHERGRPERKGETVNAGKAHRQFREARQRNTAPKPSPSLTLRGGRPSRLMKPFGRSIWLPPEQKATFLAQLTRKPKQQPLQLQAIRDTAAAFEIAVGVG